MHAKKCRMVSLKALCNHQKERNTAKKNWICYTSISHWSERDRGFRVTGFPGEKLIVPYLDLAVMILYRAGRSVPPCPASSKEQKDANKGVLGATGTAKPLRGFFSVLRCAHPHDVFPCSPCSARLQALLAFSRKSAVPVQAPGRAATLQGAYY